MLAVDVPWFQQLSSVLNPAADVLLHVLPPFTQSRRKSMWSPPDAANVVWLVRTPVSRSPTNPPVMFGRLKYGSETMRPRPSATSLFELPSDGGFSPAL